MIKKEPFIVALVAILGSAVVFYAGVNSDVYLGDESPHYFVASKLYEDKEGAFSDPNFTCKVLRVTLRGYSLDILWHTLLAGLWGLSGQRSQLIAQLYQACWYFLLVLSVYLLGKELYNKTTGMYGAILCATMPFAVAYSILLYIDVPVTALTTLTLWMAIKKSYLWAGVFMGLALLTKRNALLILPSVFILLFLKDRVLFELSELRNQGVKQYLVKGLAFTPLTEFGGVNIKFLRIAILYRIFSVLLELPNQGIRKWFNKIGVVNFLKFAIPIFVVMIPSLYYRHKYASAVIPPQHLKAFLTDAGNQFTGFLHPENFLLHPGFILKFIGPVLLLCMILYILNKRYEKQDLLLWIPITIYISMFVVCLITMAASHSADITTFKTRILRLATSAMSIRYFSPVLPLLALIAGKELLSINTRHFRTILLAIAFMQMFTTAVYVQRARTIPPDLREAYNFFSRVYPHGQTVFCNKTALGIHTPHNPLRDMGKRMALRDLYWLADDKEIFSILKAHNISYVFVEKDMIFDDSRVRNTGGYPKSFVEKLPRLPFLKPIFTNGAAQIWQVQKGYKYGVSVKAHEGKEAKHRRMYKPGFGYFIE